MSKTKPPEEVNPNIRWQRWGIGEPPPPLEPILVWSPKGGLALSALAKSKEQPGQVQVSDPGSFAKFCEPTHWSRVSTPVEEAL